MNGFARARSMHIVRVPDEAETAFIRACEELPELLGATEGGPLAGEVCRSAAGAGHWVIIHEWPTLDDFSRLRTSTRYGAAMEAIERHVSESRLLVFVVEAEFRNGKESKT